MKLHLPKRLFTALLTAITLAAAPAALTLGSAAWGEEEASTPAESFAVDYSVFNGYAYDIYQWTGTDGLISKGYWYEMEYDGEKGGLDFVYAEDGITKQPSGTSDSTSGYEGYIVSYKTLVFDANSSKNTSVQSGYAVDTAYVYDCGPMKLSGVVVKNETGVADTLVGNHNESGKRELYIGGLTTNSETGKIETSYSIIEKDFAIDTNNSDVTLQGVQVWQVASGATYTFKTRNSTERIITLNGNLTLQGGTVDFQSALKMTDAAVLTVEKGAKLTATEIKSAGAENTERSIFVNEGASVTTGTLWIAYNMGSVDVDGLLNINTELYLGSANRANTERLLTGTGVITASKLRAGNWGSYGINVATLNIGASGLLVENEAVLNLASTTTTVSGTTTVNSGNVLNFNSGSATLTGEVTNSGNININGGVVAMNGGMRGAGSLSIAEGAELIIAAGSTMELAHTITGTGTLTLNGTLNLTDISQLRGYSASYSDGVSGFCNTSRAQLTEGTLVQGGGASITVSGMGAIETVRFDAATGYLTATYAAGGTYYVNDSREYSAASMGTATNLNISSTGTLEVDLSAEEAVALPLPISNSGVLNIDAGANDVALNSLFGGEGISQASTASTTITTTGAVTVDDAALNTHGTLEINNAATFANNQNRLVVDKLVLNNVAAATINGTDSGTGKVSGTIEVLGKSKLILTGSHDLLGWSGGSNDFTDKILLRGTDADNLATLQLNTRQTCSTAIVLEGYSSITNGGSAMTNPNNSNNNVGMLHMHDGGSITATGTNNVISAVLKANTATSIAVTNQSDTLDITGAVIGGNAITKSGAGTLTFAGNMSHLTGAVNVTGGTVNLAGSATLSNTSNFSVTNNATLSMQGDKTIGTLSAEAGKVEIAAGKTLTLGGADHSIGTLTGNTGSKLHLTANAELDKVNTIRGTVTLTGSGTYNYGSYTADSAFAPGFTLDADNWTGTVALTTGGSGIQLTHLKNASTANSKLQLTGFKGYLDDADHTMSNNLILINGAQGYGLRLDNGGWAQNLFSYFTGSIEGTGNLVYAWKNTDGSAVATHVISGNTSAWEGKFVRDLTDGSGSGVGKDVVVKFTAGGDVFADTDTSGVKDAQDTGKLSVIIDADTDTNFRGTIENVANVTVLSNTQFERAVTTASLDVYADTTFGSTLTSTQANLYGGALTLESGASATIGTLNVNQTTAFTLETGAALSINAVNVDSSNHRLDAVSGITYHTKNADGSYTQTNGAYGYRSEGGTYMLFEGYEWSGTIDGFDVSVTNGNTMISSTSTDVSNVFFVKEGSVTLGGSAPTVSLSSGESVHVAAGATLNIAGSVSGVNVLTTTTGSGTIVLNDNATLGDGSTTRFHGDLEIATGKKLTLGHASESGNRNKVNTVSLNSIILNGGELYVRCVDTGLGDIVVKEGSSNSKLSMYDSFRKGDHTTISKLTLNADLTLECSWKSNLDIGVLTGSGTLNTSHVKESDSVYISIDSLAGFTGSMDFDGKNENFYTYVDINTGESSDTNEQLHFNTLSGSLLDRFNFNVQRNTEVKTLSAATGVVNVSAGKTLTLGGGTAETPVTHSIGTLTGGAGSYVNLAQHAVLNKVSTVNGTVALTGSGTYDLGALAAMWETGNAASILGVTLADDWSGVVKVSGNTSSSDNDVSGARLADLAKAYSWVELDSVEGWIYGNPSGGYDHAVNLILSGTGLTIKTSSERWYGFSKSIKGTGNFTLATASGDTQSYNFTGDISGWAGAFVVNANGTATPTTTLNLTGGGNLFSGAEDSGVVMNRGGVLNVNIGKADADTTMRGSIGFGDEVTTGTLNLTVQGNTEFQKTVDVSQMTVNNGKTATLNAATTVGTMAAGSGSVTLGDSVTLTLGGGTANAQKQHSIGTLSGANASVTLGNHATLNLGGGGTAETPVTHSIGTLTGGSGSNLHLKESDSTIFNGSITGINAITMDTGVRAQFTNTVNASKVTVNGSVQFDKTLTLSGNLEFSGYADNRAELHAAGNSVLVLDLSNKSSAKGTLVLKSEASLTITNDPKAGGGALWMEENTSVQLEDKAWLKWGTVTVTGTGTDANPGVILAGEDTNQKISVESLSFSNINLAVADSTNSTVEASLTNSSVTNNGSGILTVKDGDDLTAVTAAEGNVNVDSEEIRINNITVGAGENRKVSLKGDALVITATDSTKAATMTQKADTQGSLTRLQEDASFTIQDMTLTNTSITAATVNTQVSFDNVTVSGAVVLKNLKVAMSDAQVATGGSEGRITFSASTTLLSGITMSAGSSLTVDLGDLSSYAAMGPGKYDLSITLSGFSMDAYTGAYAGSGLQFAADSWLGELLAQSNNANVQISITQAEEGAAAAAAGAGSASTGVSYSTGNVGMVITITGLNVPEPTTATLSLLALAALAGRRRRK